MNVVILKGNLVRDPELRYTPAGTAICEFTIAKSKKWKNAEGDWIEKPGFYNCLCWGRRGEVISEHFGKGKPILVRGELEFQQWETKEGSKRNGIKVNVQDFDFCGNSKASEKETSGPQHTDSPEPDINEEEIPF